MPENRPEAEPPRPTATLLTFLFTIAMFVNMWWDSQSTDYNGVQNSLILAALAIAPPGIRVGGMIAPLLIKVLERISGSGGERK